ncbi:hypothetical protein SAMN02745194_04221 [Roseomonas rosea]|uniref:Uncharacterized protein n=1 Tax=Muricoccus roseus TaxID=198092 RepID=A0A1M6PV88_9PROT|nr:hypothetical protein SAMN02745194_04221 [Roseomonas rosea]
MRAYPLVLFSKKSFDPRSGCAGCRACQKDAAGNTATANVLGLLSLPPRLDPASEVSLAHLRWDNHQIGQRHCYLRVVRGSPHKVDHDVIMLRR